ncbi:FKBP-type peptidyl-prolyl cis-trans isomerase FklB [Marinospirillum celere]|uniref:Peptidyl-prolyl cis-trans isomerase n=1 Tax=Marinospirillum celere TaxID=1122252 RepID=A0A1I1I956_9GAMM|nr:FKBP-type peptidyl-prolyl cis-trans isomerase [Marinospirillum celere]SFC30808.1 FKBP-type peptidyl-prolyl cis-trans isomerase FklB [Marinospirillum celere]
MLKPLSRVALATSLSLTLALPATLMAAPSTEEERIGYSLGIMVGRQLQQDVRDLDIESFSQALQDLYSGETPRLNDQEIAEVLENLQEKLMQQAELEAESSARENLARGQEFLEENATKEGVEVTESGLQYRVISQGDGEIPSSSSTVKVHYEGSLIDGTVFDSSYQRGEPVSFQVNQVIQGWQEALQLMPAGSEWELYIPAELAYGQAGAGGAIGPNETLIFKVELQEVTD